MLAKLPPTAVTPMKGRLSFSLLAAITTLTACFGSVHAGPVPSISDFSADVSKPLKFEFECPDEVKLQKASSVDTSNLSDRARLLMLKQLEESKTKSLKCFVEFTRDRINVNDMQIIPRESVKKFWEMFNLTSTSSERFYCFLYKSSAEGAYNILKIKTAKGFSASRKEGHFYNNYFQTWMSLP